MSQDITLKAASATIPDIELEPTFLQGMVNRRMQGYRKYGTASANTADRIANVEDRLRLYRETGNTEWLMDAAVFAWIEFMYPAHENGHFRATGDDESPGAIMREGHRWHGKAAREEAARQAYAGRSGD
jgi:hypothetical protein